MSWAKFKCTACPRSSALSTNPGKKECALFSLRGFSFVRVVWVQDRSSATGLNGSLSLSLSKPISSAVETHVS